VHKVELKNERNKIFFDKLMYVYVELPKFTKQEHELETMRDKWLFTLKNLVYLQERPRALQERVFEKIFEIAEVAKFNHAEMEAYQSSLKSFRDNHNIYKSNIERAMEEGEEIGIKKGRKEGEKLGIEKGEKKKAEQTALRMIAKAYDNATIHELTGLSIEEIEKLRQME
ncbi:MAG: PD-(D/E)XK nuclease family transposase, partial [Bacteroidales bacterium]